MPAFSATVFAPFSQRVLLPFENARHMSRFDRIHPLSHMFPPLPGDHYEGRWFDRVYPRKATALNGVNTRPFGSTKGAMTAHAASRNSSFNFCKGASAGPAKTSPVTRKREP